MFRFQPQINGVNIASILQSDNVTFFAPSVNGEAMLRFQPKINGNSIELPLRSDILSTSLLHSQLMLKLC